MAQIFSTEAKLSVKMLDPNMTKGYTEELGYLAPDPNTQEITIISNTDNMSAAVRADVNDLLKAAASLTNGTATKRLCTYTMEVTD